MPIQDDIDSSAQQIADLVDKAKAELIAGLYEIGVDVEDVNALANALLTIDIEGTLKSKIQKATSIYAQAHRQVLESTIGFADINPASLTTFAKLNEQLFDQTIINTIAGNIRKELVTGIQSGLPLNTIIQSVSNSSISNAQMQTLVNTTLNTYSRTITNQMMENAPATTKYVYVGPVDDRTRLECLDYASAGEITEAEIIGNGWTASLIDGGGFNCRHKWEIASTEGKGFSEQSKVEGQRQENAR